MCAISWQAVGHGGGLGDDGEGGGNGEGGGLGGDDDRSGWLPSDLLPSGGGDDAERPASPKCKKAHHAPQQSKSPTAATLRQRQSGAMRGLRGVATFCVVGMSQDTSTASPHFRDSGMNMKLVASISSVNRDAQSRWKEDPLSVHV